MKRLVVLFFLAFAAPLLAAQQPAVSPTSGAQDATVTYLFSWPQGVPWTKYSISVKSDGTTHFSGVPHPDSQYADTDPVEQDFTMWENNRQKIFELAQKLNYFQGNLDAHLKHIAQTGSKTLEYQSPQVHGSSTFNYSQDADVQALNNLFMGIATSVDYGRKLTFQYRFDKLGMDQRLKELQGLLNDHQVEELHIIAPILRKIAADPNLMNISRETAKAPAQADGRARSFEGTAGNSVRTIAAAVSADTNISQRQHSISANFLRKWC